MTGLKPAEGEEGLLVPVSDEELARLVVCILEGNGKPMTAEAITDRLLELLYVKVEVQIRCAIARMALAGEFYINPEGKLRLNPKGPKQKEPPSPPPTEESGVCVVTAKSGTLLAEMIEEAGATELLSRRPDLQQRRCGRCKAFTLDQKCPSCGWPTAVWRAAS